MKQRVGVRLGMVLDVLQHGTSIAARRSKGWSSDPQPQPEIGTETADRKSARLG